MVAKQDRLPIMEFANQLACEQWFTEQPINSAGAWLKFAKKDGGGKTLTKAEAIDAALCHGWIDGQLNRYDEVHWLIRFTPRKPRSKWSEINRHRASALIEEGRMQPAGLAQIEAAKADGRWESAYAPASTAETPPDLQDALTRNPKADAFFSTLKGANRYAILYRIGSVKKPETRARKIAEYVAMLEKGETLHG